MTPTKEIGHQFETDSGESVKVMENGVLIYPRLDETGITELLQACGKELARLAARVEGLEGWHETFLRTNLGDALAERDRLRETLEEIVAYDSGGPCLPVLMKRRVIEALRGGGDEET